MVVPSLSPSRRVYFGGSQNAFLGVFRGLNNRNHKTEMVRVLTMPAEYSTSNVLKQLKYSAIVTVSILKYSREKVWKLNYFQLNIRDFKVFFQCFFTRVNLNITIQKAFYSLSIAENKKLSEDINEDESLCYSKPSLKSGTCLFLSFCGAPSLWKSIS